MRSAANAWQPEHRRNVGSHRFGRRHFDAGGEHTDRCANGGGGGVQLGQVEDEGQNEDRDGVHVPPLCVIDRSIVARLQVV